MNGYSGKPHSSRIDIGLGALRPSLLATLKVSCRASGLLSVGGDMATDRQLNRRFRELFGEFNQKYFGGKLPHYRVVVADYIPNYGCDPIGKH